MVNWMNAITSTLDGEGIYKITTVKEPLPNSFLHRRMCPAIYMVSFTT
jgi:hypothetical protein